ncbi:tail protein X [Rhizobium halophytocola]|uniref:Phage tail protein X n=1 Tax=Rhizobium halophytocola TaxID=735519 RepID=A0ABS4E2F1_9HYPH|nr:tail protein X [Rhizobium halophytocola]MBP1852107.1 phage tail protein X [Rhizobium halophytocola]
MSETFTIRREGMTVELLLHQLYGVEGRSLLAQTLLDNPGLSELGAYLPLGTVIAVPDKPVKNAFAERRVVSLFGA